MSSNNNGMIQDFKTLMQEYYLLYASYVIKDRAIPDVVDGLKPVQRRLLYALWLMHDGKLHKVANVAGQTMAYHPHGDSAIIEALVNVANKGYLLDTQGNFGNLLTGDPAAAARYIETRLSPLAIETLFNPDLTAMVPSYDARHSEPTCFPAKIPLLLMQGTDGIAVGMSTSILPHNFVELLEAEIAILKGQPYTILPDFLTGGIMDASQYQKGKGKVRLRAKFDVVDAKTIVIREICHGTTTESLIRSIDEAAKKGKIKIDSIHDYTADRVEIEIKLPRGCYANDLIDSLCAYTECEVVLSPQMIGIKEGLPWESDVHEILELHVKKLQHYLQMELEIERSKLMENIFEKTLEQIFIENRLYQAIENVATDQEIHRVVAKGLEPFLFQLSREPTAKDREKLLNIPIRRISKFDIQKNESEIKAIQLSIGKVEKSLNSMQRYTIDYIGKLLKKYGDKFPRKTQIQTIERLNVRAIETRKMIVGFDPSSGFLGSKVVGEISLECTNFDKMILFFVDGTYQVIAIPEKQYVHHKDAKVSHVVVADKKSVINIVYKDLKSRCFFAKRFVVEKFILEKTYRYLDEEMELQFFSLEENPVLKFLFLPKLRQKTSQMLFEFKNVAIKGVFSKGVRISPREIKKFTVVEGNGSFS